MTPTHLIGSVYAVEVPEGAENIRISQLIGTPKLFADIPGYLYASKLPPGNWQIICTTKEVTDAIASQIVDKVDSEGRGYVYMNYANGMYVFSKSLSSLRSLIASKGLDPDKTLIIKKVS